MAQVALSGREPRTELSTADGTPLKAALARARAARSGARSLLVLPLLLFVLVTFVVPIGQMLYRSVANPAFSDEHAEPGGAWFAANPSGTEPDEAAFAALVADLRRRRRGSARSAWSAPASTTTSRARARCSPPPGAAPTRSSRRSARR